jgi:hypothetical protein
VKIPYYVVIKGRGYWRPTAKMRELGFAMIRCGKDGPPAWAIAQGWAERWERTRKGVDQAPVAVIAGKHTPEQAESAIVYPRGSLGEAFARYRKLDQWGKAKKPATRDDWWRGWKRIKPFFGDVRPSTVTLEQIDAWRAYLLNTTSIREAHRALKIWRALWKVAAAMKYCERDADPSLGVRNTAALGRSDTWSEGEVVRIIKTAWRLGYRGLAAALAVQWDTQMSPVDVRTLTSRQMARDALGAIYFTTRRGKTDTPVGGVLSPRAARLLTTYLEGLGAELLPDAPIFRSRGSIPSEKGGRPWAPRPFTKDRYAEEFREVRSALLGAAENRKSSDMRRSGAVEAIAGKASAEQLSRAMGNPRLFERAVRDLRPDRAGIDPRGQRSAPQGPCETARRERMMDEKYQLAGRESIDRLLGALSNP